MAASCVHLRESTDLLCTTYTGRCNLRIMFPPAISTMTRLQRKQGEESTLQRGVIILVVSVVAVAGSESLMIPRTRTL